MSHKNSPPTFDLNDDEAFKLMADAFPTEAEQRRESLRPRPSGRSFSAEEPQSGHLPPEPSAQPAPRTSRRKRNKSPPARGTAQLPPSREIILGSPVDPTPRGTPPQASPHGSRPGTPQQRRRLNASSSSLSSLSSLESNLSDPFQLSDDEAARVNTSLRHSPPNPHVPIPRQEAAAKKERISCLDFALCSRATLDPVNRSPQPCGQSFKDKFRLLRHQSKVKIRCPYLAGEGGSCTKSVSICLLYVTLEGTLPLHLKKEHQVNSKNSLEDILRKARDDFLASPSQLAQTPAEFEGASHVHASRAAHLASSILPYRRPATGEGVTICQDASLCPKSRGREGIACMKNFLKESALMRHQTTKYYDCPAPRCTASISTCVIDPSKLRRHLASSQCSGGLDEDARKDLVKDWQLTHRDDSIRPSRSTIE